MLWSPWGNHTQAAGCRPTPAAIKASAGAVEFVPVAKVTNISDTLDLLKRHGLWVAGSDMDGETYTSKDLTGPIAWWWEARKGLDGWSGKSATFL